MQTIDPDAPTETLLSLDGRVVRLRMLASDEEARECALIMSTTEPWVTIGRGYAASLSVVRDPAQEAYVALDDDGVAGFVLVVMTGALVGYIRSVAVRGDFRGRGLGSALIAFSERRIFRDVPNVFLCVSSFNERAKALYERLGYRIVGELPDYVVRGHSEWLLRKTIGPLLGGSPRAEQSPALAGQRTPTR